MSKASSKYEITIDRLDAPDIRAYFDSQVFRVWHLGGKERTFRIVDVARVTSEFRGKLQQQPLLFLENRRGERHPMPLALNRTNQRTLSGLYGNNPKHWIGKTFTMYPTTTELAGEQVECIRVRPQIPQSRSRREPAPPVYAEPRALPEVADADFEHLPPAFDEAEESGVPR